MDPQEQLPFLYEIFDPSLPRLGPGDTASTIKALTLLLSAGGQRIVDPVPGYKILDIGCGVGAQTIALARHIEGTIVALDNHQPFLTELQRRAEAEGVADKIRPYQKDMRDAGLEKGSFDLIWSEGALYIMGFAQGLTACHDLLAEGGSMAVSELCWLKPDPPEACRQYFASEYPVIADVDANLATIKKCGYDLVGHFTLPESAWLESFYVPLEERLQLLRKKYIADQERMDLIDSVEMEIALYRRYGNYYGYEFFLMQKSRRPAV
jgi:SAM-dependent methyltransferase